jgi:hypothetical protein
MPEFFYDEPTWREIYFEVLPHLKKDKTFSSDDLIRIYHNNLHWEEQQYVLEYFCNQLCEENYPNPTSPPEPIPPPAPILLPPIIIPIPPPQPPPQVLPPPEIIPLLPNFLVPTFPFIIFELLPPDILNMLRDAMGINEAHAAEIEGLMEIIDDLREQPVLPDPDIPFLRHPLPGKREFERLEKAIAELVAEREVLMSQNEALVSQNEALIARNDHLNNEIWKYLGSEVSHDDEIWESWLEGLEEPEPEYIPDPDIEREQTDIDEHERVMIGFYQILNLLEAEADRLKMDFEWRGYIVSNREYWYMFRIDGTLMEYSLSELPGLLKVLKNLDTPDQAEV